MSEDPYQKPPLKRFESDANFRIPVDELRKCSDSNAPPPPLADAMREAQDGPAYSEPPSPPCSLCGDLLGSPDGRTMEECPKCGEGMVLPAIARAYRAGHPDTHVDEGMEIDLTSDPDDEDPTP